MAVLPEPLFQEWMAFDRLEPVSDGHRLDVGLASLQAVLYNIAAAPAIREKKLRPYTLLDFLPAWHREPEENERPKDNAHVPALLAWVAELNAAFGGLDLRGKRQITGEG